MIGGALYVRVTLQGLARLCISLTSHLATFCTFADVAAFARYCHVHIPLLGLRYTRSVHGTSHRAVFSEMSDCYLFALTMVSHANFTVSGRSEATMYEVSRRGLYRRRMAKPQDANGMGSSR